MSRLSKIINSFKISKERIEELYVEISQLPDGLIHVNETSLSNCIFRELKITKENEKQFISFVVFSFVHVN